MRTLKALLCLAGVAAATSVMAQSNVYSLNVVGYYNVTCGANQKIIIANQLNTTNNTLNALLPAGMVHDSDSIFKWNGAGFTPYTYSEIDGWSPNGDDTLGMGEAAFFLPVTATTLTFVGEVQQGQLSVNLIYPSQSMGSKVLISSIVPQQGLLSTDLGFVAEDSDSVWTYNPAQDGNAYIPYVYSEIDGWSPSEPSLSVGQGFFSAKSPVAATASWVRNFTVQ